MRREREAHLLDSPLPELLRAVTGIEPDRSGKHAMLKLAGVRSTQRLGLGDVGGGVAVVTWPAELGEQARYLYEGRRGPSLLEAAAREWVVDLRPHLGFWLSPASERLYMNPEPSMTVEEYVARWAGQDGEKIGGHRWTRSARSYGRGCWSEAMRPTWTHRSLRDS